LLGLTVGLLGSADAQYPKVPAAVRAEAAARAAQADRRSDEAFAQALPVIRDWAARGKPYLPGAAEPGDLPQGLIPAFPGAWGGGRYALGGRGGRVIVVTNLNDRGPGSFRAACEAGGPRIVLFNVAGIIRLEDRVRIRAPHLTLSGATAPGDGVCIAGNTVEVETHDVVIRHLRFRRGATWVGDRNDALGGHPVGNLIDNYYQPGPITPRDQPISYRLLKPESERSRSVVDNFGKAYVAGNVVVGNPLSKGIITHPDQVGGYPEYRGEPYPDTDGDGLPDQWEQQHGLDCADPTDATADADEDGYTNVEEFLNGTHPKKYLLAAAAFAPYIARFNTMEDENVTHHVSNAQAFEWLAANIPRFECPDREVEEIYYFRWWSFRKHLKWTPQGFVWTEFLVPVKHAGNHNTIGCAVGHHLAEGRWLHDGRFMDDYTRFWLYGHDGKPQPHFHQYSSWFAAAVWERYLVNGDHHFVTRLLDDLAADYRVWETERLLPDGLFWQHDVKDGMEESISGSRTAKQARPTINSYLFANARAIAAIATLAGREGLATEFQAKAETLRGLTQEQLWDPAAKFFKVRHEDGSLAQVREAIGFIPWAFGLPKPGRGYEVAWAQFSDPSGFSAPSGLTTAERRHPQFRSHGCCRCEWDGAVWPFATSQTLGALANVLRDHTRATRPSSPASTEPARGEDTERILPVSRRDYFEAFLTYTRSHRFDGRPYIGEYLDEITGHWLKGRHERSRYYNHSTFADLLIAGVIGLRPRTDDVVEVHPLLPEGTWPWFCLDGVPYHGHRLTILWDADGSRYRRGRGLRVLADGKPVAHADHLEPVTGRLP